MNTPEPGNPWRDAYGRASVRAGQTLLLLCLATVLVYALIQLRLVVRVIHNELNSNRDVRRTLQVGAEHLTDKQAARLDAKLALGDPDHEVTLAWQCYQKLRNIYHARPDRGRELVAEVIASFPACPIPEVARLGRALKHWKTAILAYFDTFGASNGPTEAINGVIETHPQNRPGLPNFTNYRLRCLLAAGGHRPYRIKHTNRHSVLVRKAGTAQVRYSLSKVRKNLSSNARLRRYDAPPGQSIDRAVRLGLSQRAADLRRHAKAG